MAFCNIRKTGMRLSLTLWVATPATCFYHLMCTAEDQLHYYLRINLPCCIYNNLSFRK